MLESGGLSPGRLPDVAERTRWGHAGHGRLAPVAGLPRRARRAGGARPRPPRGGGGRGGRRPPQLEAKFLAWPSGAPSHPIALPHLAEMKDLLVKKLVLELHPSP